MEEIPRRPTPGQRLLIWLKQFLVVVILLAFGVDPIAWNICLYHR